MRTKNSKILVGIILIAIVIIGAISLNVGSTSAFDKTYNFSDGINSNVMKMLPDNIKNNTSEKYSFDVENMTNKNSTLQLNLRMQDKDNNEDSLGKATGTIRIGERNYGFSAEGYFDKVVVPDTKETLYYGLISGELKGVKMNPDEPSYNDFDGKNTSFIIIFNPEKPEDFYVSTTVGFKEYTGVLIFGQTDVHQKYYSAPETRGELK
jgi:hypothetical protein